MHDNAPGGAWSPPPSFPAPPDAARRKRSKAMVVLLVLGGFALLACGVVGILAALALPSFTKYRDRAIEMEAQATLHGLSAAQAAFHLEHDRYAADLVELEWCATADQACDRTAHFRYDTNPLRSCATPLGEHGLRMCLDPEGRLVEGTSGFAGQDDAPPDGAALPPPPPETPEEAAARRESAARLLEVLRRGMDPPPPPPAPGGGPASPP